MITPKIESIIYKDTHFTIEHVLDYAIPGYLILYFNDRNSFKNQHRVTLTTLGILLSQIVNCINETIHPKKIYCLMFGEKEERPHFHLFPRT